MKPFKLIFKYAHNYTLPLALTIISMLLLVGVQLAVPWIIKILVDNVTNTSSQPTSQPLPLINSSCAASCSFCAATRRI